MLIPNLYRMWPAKPKEFHTPDLNSVKQVGIVVVTSYGKHFWLLIHLNKTTGVDNED
jgi:hypothetical protein